MDKIELNENDIENLEKLTKLPLENDEDYQEFSEYFDEEE